MLRPWARRVTLTGPVGAGNVTKLANQIMVACNIAAMGEALVLATKAGLDPEVVFNAIKGGPGRQHRAERQGAHGDRRATSSRASASGSTRRTCATRCWRPNR